MPKWPVPQTPLPDYDHERCTETVMGLRCVLAAGHAQPCVMEAAKIGRLVAVARKSKVR